MQHDVVFPRIYTKSSLPSPRQLFSYQLFLRHHMLDSHYSHVHFSHPNQAAFMEEWNDYKITPNDIDTTRLFEATADLFPQFLLEEEEDGSIPLSSSVFGAKVYRNKNVLQTKAWEDLNLGPLRSDAILKKQQDQQILHPLYNVQTEDLDLTLNEFLSNGYKAEPELHADILADNMSNDDIWLNTTSEYLANHTFSNMKLRKTSNNFSGPHNSSYVGQTGAQTPRVARRRPSQEKFQTPITRIR